MNARKMAMVMNHDVHWTVVTENANVEIQGLDAAMHYASNYSPDAIRLINARRRTITLVAGHSTPISEQLECA
jgi:hypothetical protein